MPHRTHTDIKARLQALHEALGDVRAGAHAAADLAEAELAMKRGEGEGAAGQQGETDGANQRS